MKDLRARIATGDLLVTKWQVPQLPTSSIQRPRLLEQMHQALTRQLVLLSAPAGYGKTTLLADWCALDTLAFPALLGRTARVISSCPVTGQEIRLTVTPETIADLEPADAVVSVRLPGEDTDICHVQEDICNDGYFFVSHEVASAWPSLHPKAVLLSVEEAA